jgi:hypothetical protein
MLIYYVYSGQTEYKWMKMKQKRSCRFRLAESSRRLTHLKIMWVIKRHPTHLYLSECCPEVILHFGRALS